MFGVHGYLSGSKATFPFIGGIRYDGPVPTGHTLGALASAVQRGNGWIELVGL